MKSLTTALLTSLFIQSLASAQEQGSKEFYFLENKGQWPEEVLFHTSLAGQAVWITDHGITYDYYRIVPDSMEVATEEDWYYDEYDHRTYSRTGQVVVQHWEGSSPPDHKEANKRLLAYNNYFIGRDSSKWTSRVGRFAEVLLHNIYPYIDVRYYFQAQHLRYDFILHPGADPDDIRMKFEGAELIDFTNERFSLSTLMGDVTHDDLQAWQPFPENQQQVSASFRWLKPSTIGFHVHWTDRKRDLIIDPIIWATYLGGANSDEIFDMDLDAENNVFITGKTHGFYYPITPGAYFQETTQSQFHIFLSKISMDGTELLFSSIFGEDNIIHFTRMAVDPSGCPIVGSFTNNDNYPITEGAFQSELLSENITLSKLSSDGTELLFSTFFGGSWGTEIGDIAVDEENNIYFTGKSRYSDDYPLTVEPEENLMPSSTNVIFVKMNASGSELICSNMLGGSENEGGHVIAIRPDHHILIGGITRSPDFPVSENAIQSELLEEYVNDGFVIELDSSGAEIIYSTLIGSTGDSYWNDRIRALLWCENGDYLLVGCTAAEDFPTTSNAQDSTYNGGYGNVVNLDGDVFITRISPESNQPVYSSYWGGSAHDLVFDAAFDSQERLIVVGRTSSFDLEVTQNVIDSTLSEGDLFLLDVSY